jgi:hypothetical protein
MQQVEVDTEYAIGIFRGPYSDKWGLEIRPRSWLLLNVIKMWERTGVLQRV